MSLPQPPPPSPLDVLKDQQFHEVVWNVFRYRRSSADFIRRKLSMGYNKATLMRQHLIDLGIVSAEVPADGSASPILKTFGQWIDMLKAAGVRADPGCDTYCDPDVVRMVMPEQTRAPVSQGSGGDGQTIYLLMVNHLEQDGSSTEMVRDAYVSRELAEAEHAKAEARYKARVEAMTPERRHRHTMERWSVNEVTVTGATAAPATPAGHIGAAAIPSIHNDKLTDAQWGELAETVREVAWGDNGKITLGDGTHIHGAGIGLLLARQIAAAVVAEYQQAQEAPATPAGAGRAEAVRRAADRICDLAGSDAFITRKEIAAIIHTELGAQT